MVLHFNNTFRYSSTVLFIKTLWMGRQLISMNTKSSEGKGGYIFTRTASIPSPGNWTPWLSLWRRSRCEVPTPRRWQNTALYCVREREREKRWERRRRECICGEKLLTDIYMDHEKAHSKQCLHLPMHHSLPRHRGNMRAARKRHRPCLISLHGESGFHTEQ